MNATFLTFRFGIGHLIAGILVELHTLADAQDFICEVRQHYRASAQGSARVQCPSCH
jgi:hypothetical protein